MNPTEVVAIDPPSRYEVIMAMEKEWTRRPAGSRSMITATAVTSGLVLL